MPLSAFLIRTVKLYMIKKLWLTLFLFLLSSVALAQNKVPKLTKTFTDPISGLTVNYPADWNVIPVGDSSQGGIKLSNQNPNTMVQDAIKPGEMGVEIISPKQVEGLVGGADFE